LTVDKKECKHDLKHKHIIYTTATKRIHGFTKTVYIARDYQICLRCGNLVTWARDRN